MGPQSFNCGNHSWFYPRVRCGQACQCFNGAAVFQLRKQVSDFWGTAELARWLSFNGAAVFQLRKPTQWLPWRHRSARQCFNGAAVFQLRKLFPELDAVGFKSQSSLLTIAGFNGAAVFQLRKPTNCAAILLSGDTIAGRFNGAAVFQLRKRAERSCRMACLTRASMGPQSFNCGNAYRTDLPRAPFAGFNGAAVFQLRKRLPVTGGAG